MKTLPSWTSCRQLEKQKDGCQLQTQGLFPTELSSFYSSSAWWMGKHEWCTKTTLSLVQHCCVAPRTSWMWHVIFHLTAECWDKAEATNQCPHPVLLCHIWGLLWGSLAWLCRLRDFPRGRGTAPFHLTGGSICCQILASDHVEPWYGLDVITPGGRESGANC